MEKEDMHSSDDLIVKHSYQKVYDVLNDPENMLILTL